MVTGPDLQPGIYWIGDSESPLSTLASGFGVDGYYRTNGAPDPFAPVSDFAPLFSTFNLAIQMNGEVAAAPEPGSWGMMIGGFACAGMMMRKRRKHVQFA